MQMEVRDLVGFEGVYTIREDGQVVRVGKATGARVGRVVADTPHKFGYRTVSLHKDGKAYQRLVHVLVAQTFLGPCPTGHEVNHIDGVKHHNHYTNLEYLTRKDNLAHAREIGLYDFAGERNPMAVLTNDQVREIRALYVPHVVGYKQLAARFGVSWSVVRNVIKGKAWKTIN